MSTPFTPEQRIDNSIAWLNIHSPKQPWYEHVDLDILCLIAGDRCVGGQLWSRFPGDVTAFGRAYELLLQEPDVTDANVLTIYGFWEDSKSTGQSMTALWKEAILVLRSTQHPPEPEHLPA